MHIHGTIITHKRRNVGQTKAIFVSWSDNKPTFNIDKSCGQYGFVISACFSLGYLVFYVDVLFLNIVECLFFTT